MSTADVVHVVDDDPSCRKALTRMLSAAGLSVQSYASGSELLTRLSHDEAAIGPACVLADLRMPGLDGLQLQQACSKAGIHLPFVFLTGLGDVPSAVSAMRQGAVDYLDKCAPQHALLAALEQALERDRGARTSHGRREQLKRRFALLTKREWEVLRHAVHGKMNKQIASTLGISERTVKLHRTAIFTKLGVRRLAELATLAPEAGLFEDDRRALAYSVPEQARSARSAKAPVSELQVDTREIPGRARTDV